MLFYYCRRTLLRNIWFSCFGLTDNSEFSCWARCLRIDCPLARRASLIIYTFFAPSAHATDRIVQLRCFWRWMDRRGAAEDSGSRAKEEFLLFIYVVETTKAFRSSVPCPSVNLPPHFTLDDSCIAWNRGFLTGLMLAFACIRYVGSNICPYTRAY